MTEMEFCIKICITIVCYCVALAAVMKGEEPNHINKVTDKRVWQRLINN